MLSHTTVLSNGLDLISCLASRHHRYRSQDLMGFTREKSPDVFRKPSTKFHGKPDLICGTALSPISSGRARNCLPRFVSVSGAKTDLFSTGSYPVLTGSIATTEK